MVDMVQLEESIRTEENRWLALEAAFVTQDKMQAELEDSAQYKDTEDVLQTLLHLQRRISTMRKNSYCLQRIKQINAVDKVIAEISVNHIRTAGLRESSIDALTSVVGLSMKVATTRKKLSGGVLHFLHVLAQEKVVRISESESVLKR